MASSRDARRRLPTRRSTHRAIEASAERRARCRASAARASASDGRGRDRDRRRGAGFRRATATRDGGATTIATGGDLEATTRDDGGDDARERWDDAMGRATRARATSDRRADGRRWAGRDEDARGDADRDRGETREDGTTDGTGTGARTDGTMGGAEATARGSGGAAARGSGGAARRPDPRDAATREALASRWLEKNANGTAKVSDYNAEKLRREIYVGNLVSGQIGATTLCELLNDVLKKIVPEACHAVGKLPPVLSIVMDSAQKYASLEMRSSALATAALGLDQMHVLGRPLHITRPAGYFDDPDAKRQVLNVEHVLPAPEKLQQVYDHLDARKIEESKSKDEAIERAKKMAASVSESAVQAAAPTPAEATEYLCLENMVDVKTLLSARERKELRYDIEDECGKCGKVVRVVVPTPSDDEVERKAASRAYVYFARVGSAESAHKVMHGRKFGGRIVQARYIEASEFEAFDKK